MKFYRKNFIKTIAKTFISSILGVPFVMLTVSCSNIKNAESNNNGDYDDNDDFISADQFFPNLSVEDYYDYVEFNDKAQPIIGDKFIMKVIDDVVSRVASSKGTIKFSVQRYSDSSVVFHFKWIYLDKTLYKTYSFEIRK